MELLFKNYVKKGLIFRLEKDDKFDLITRFAERTCKPADIPGQAVFVEELLNRERQLSTGIGLSVQFHKYHVNGMLIFESISTNDECGVPLVVRK